MQQHSSKGLTRERYAAVFVDSLLSFKFLLRKHNILFPFKMIWSICLFQAMLDRSSTPRQVTSIHVHEMFGLRLAHNNCDFGMIYMYIYSQYLNLLSLPRVNKNCTCERNMHVTVLLLVNWSCTCEQDLQLTSASPHTNRTIVQGNAIKHEIHITISTYHAIPGQALSYTMPCPPGHAIHHAISLQAISSTMPCPPGDII